MAPVTIFRLVYAAVLMVAVIVGVELWVLAVIAGFLALSMIPRRASSQKSWRTPLLAYSLTVVFAGSFVASGEYVVSAAALGALTAVAICAWEAIEKVRHSRASASSQPVTRPLTGPRHPPADPPPNRFPPR
jgi:energy-converting hydrogenase Eha subunit A